MKEKSQQKQTKDYFDKNSSNWKSKAKKETEKSVNVIKQRNDFVLNICKKYLKKQGKTLDIGCGTGDLVFAQLKHGFDSYGIDFAPSMIKKASTYAKKNNVDPNRFFLDSIFNFEPTQKFDLISANGFIEYISEKELKLFIKKSSKWLTKNGVLVLGSRNRLFNVFSFNEFTKIEIKNNTLKSLIDECIFFNSIKQTDALFSGKKLTIFKKNLKKHPFTGIGVKTRLQYSPLELISYLQSNSMKVLKLEPINIHLFTTSGRKLKPILHDYLSNKIQNESKIHLQLLPQSSSFMIAVRI
jgi:2-polyprenyl-3-methyl-5-hydroxy-6-metoxy-1,4-benzoquinol methylase